MISRARHFRSRRGRRRRGLAPGRREGAAPRRGRGFLPGSPRAPRPVYRAVADAVVRDADDAALAAGGVRVEVGGIERLACRPERRARRSRRGRPRGRHPRCGGPACTRPKIVRVPRASGRRGGEDARSRRADLARAPAAETARSSPSAGLGHGRRWVRRRDLSTWHSLGRRADDARRAGRRGHRRQDRDRPPGRQEPRRRLPLARENGDRPCPARDASAGGAQGRHRRGREDRTPGRRDVLGSGG